MPARSMSIHGIPRRQLLHPRDLIGQRVVAHVAVVGLVELLRPPRRPHPVDLDDDEAELGERLRIAARRVEGAAADAAGLRTGIDVVDDRILLRRIERGRLVHQAVEIGDAVARLDGNRQRRLPAGGHQPGDVGLFEREDQLAVRIAQLRHRRHVGLRIDVDEETAGRRERHVVIGVLRRQQLQVPAVHADAIQMAEVRVAPLLAADRDEIELPVLLVDAQQLGDVAVAAGDRVLLAAGLQVVQVEMAPVVALGEPDHLVRRRQVSPVDGAVARLEERLGLLLRARPGSRRWPRRRRASPRAGDRARWRRTRCSRCRGSTARRPSRRGRRRRRTASNDAGRAAAAAGRSSRSPRR